MARRKRSYSMVRHAAVKATSRNLLSNLRAATSDLRRGACRDARDAIRQAYRDLDTHPGAYVSKHRQTQIRRVVRVYERKCGLFSEI